MSTLRGVLGLAPIPNSREAARENEEAAGMVETSPGWDYHHGRTPQRRAPG